MKITCIQLSTGENYKKNCSDLLKYIEQAIKQKSDLIITPEYSSILSSDKKILYKYSFNMRKDPLIKKIQKLSKKEKKWIIIGSIIVKVDNKLRNRSIVVNSDGRISSHYDKINMFDVNTSSETHKESSVFKSGNKLVTTNLPWGKIGLSICFDLRFPEIYRNLSKRNIKFITIPSSFTKVTGARHWIELLKARAIENFCYVFAPNQYGKNTKNRETYGHSAIISPDGKILKKKKKGKGLVMANIKPNESLRLRKLIPSLKI